MAEPRHFRVLVVGGGPTPWATVDRILARLGHRVAGRARDAPEAAEQVRRLRPDVVLVGFGPAAPEGAEVARHITAACPTPLVAVGPGLREPDAAAAARAGVGAVLAGRVTARSLERALAIAVTRFPDQQEIRRALAEQELRTPGTLEDERRALEARLAEARADQQRLEDIIEFLPDATFVVDNQKRVIAWNRAIEEMTGTRKEDVLGRDDYARAFYGEKRPIVIDLIGRDDREWEAKYSYVRREGRTLVAEVTVPSVFGGRGAHLWVAAAPLQDSAGNQIGAIETVRDITVRTQALAAVRQAEEKYRRIFENAIEGIFQSTRGGRLVVANPSLARILGYESPAEACAGVDLEAGVYVDPRARRELLERLRRDGAVDGFETQFRRRDGRPIWVSIHTRAARDQSGDVELLDGFLVDVTEHRRAEEALRAEKAFTDAIVDNIPGTFFVIDQAGRFVRWNKTQERVTGYSAEELREMSPLLTLAEEDRARAAEGIRQAFAAGSAFVEARARAKDGRLIPFYLSGERVTIDGVTYLVGVGIDVSARKQAEEDLRRSEERFVKAFRSSPAAIVISTVAEGRFVDMNEAATQLGFTREEMVGRTVTELGIWADPEERRRMLGALASEGRIRGWETRLRARDGRILHALLSTEMIELAGEPCLLTLLLDITARKQAEERQARLQAEIVAAADEWRAAFDAVESALFVTDAEGVVRRCNTTARTLAGAETTEIGGRTLASLGEGEPWRYATSLVSRAADSGLAVEGQVRSETLGRTWSASAAPFGADGRLIILALRDITTILDLRNSLRTKETMAAMGSLLGGVAHEVRNPLFAISALLDALDAGFDLGERMAPYLKALREQTDRLIGVMRALLDYGRPVSDERQPASLETLLQEAVDLCRRDVQEREIAVTVEAPEALPLVAVDRPRMLEAVRNVVENAIQHSPSGGTVLLQARPHPARPGWVEVRVRDLGPGFGAEDKRRVFEPFFSRRAGGTGLGLPIVQRVVSAHGGEVEVDNHPDGGGLVTLRIPVREAPAAEHAAAGGSR